MKTKLIKKTEALKFILRYDNLTNKKFYKIRFITKIILNIIKIKNKSTILFIHTSKAEERIFKQLFQKDTNPNIPKSLFSTELNGPDIKNNDVKIYKKNTSPLIAAILYPENITTVICLDHQNQNAHKNGSELILLLTKLGVKKTICLQHGGSMTDNLIGHIYSSSKFNILWGEYHLKKIKELSFSNNNKFYYLSGNPLHDTLYKSIQKKNLKTLKNQSTDKRRVILIATCLHTEYKNYPNPNKLYAKYIRSIYESIDLSEYFVIIKMHPNDSISPNLYLQNIPDFFTNNDYKCIGPNSNTPSIYDLILNCDILISRASTVIEEGLILNKKCIIFDLFKNGPSKHLDFLKLYAENVRFCYTKKSLKQLLINDTFTSRKNKCKTTINEKAARDFTLKLDGQSTNRIWDIIIKIHNNELN
ncbi:hypothetical protein ACT29H_12715 [Thermophagus sp. OGC60D27]|uniref:hypothetical protein n=1 Tax=Thermophagus sp. OGC60D27 TaxID=3458415 RepID=UPI004037FF89